MFHVTRLLKTVFSAIFLFNPISAILNFQEQQQILTHVNNYRSKHNSPPVTWNNDIENSCGQWAKTLTSINSLQHSSTTYGENLFQLYAPTQSGNVAVINNGVDIWYAEIANYDYSNPVFSPNTGHFSALIWASTKKIAAAVQFSGTNAIVVMQFFPPGNYIDQYAANVMPQTPIIQNPPPIIQNPPPIIQKSPPIRYSPPPLLPKKSYISIMYFFEYDNDYSSTTTIANNLCPALIFALYPYDAITTCKRQYASTTGTYYGMEYPESDMYLIQEHITRNVTAFTIAAQLFCRSTVALFVGTRVIYRLMASPTSCFNDN